MLYQKMFKYKIGERVKSNAEVRVYDPSIKHIKSVWKEVEGTITNSTPLLVCGKIENWYLLEGKYDVYNVKESNILEIL